MNLRALMYFDELVRSNSMRAAAEKLGVAPTAISRQIENLEEWFGTELVERSNRGVRLTAAGMLLADRAGRALREMEHTRRLIEDLKELQGGHVSIHANGAAVAAIIAPVLAEFSHQYPKLRFSVTISSAREAVEALESARADLAVTLFSPRFSGAKVLARSDVLYEAIMHAAHPLAKHERVTPGELAAHPLALPDKSFAARQAFDAVFEAEGMALDPVFVTGSIETLKELVLRGAAVTLLPALTVRREIDAGLLVSVPVASKAMVRTPVELCVSPERPLSFAAGRLADFIESFMRIEAV